LATKERKGQKEEKEKKDLKKALVEKDSFSCWFLKMMPF